ncbi:MAG: EVE domain-containing protein [Armatimonadetes bacterium]|nr:EVE domain-containing protein [Armatimonadota bacterium]
MAYWLMKSEPDCYSIDDLRAKAGPDVWEGCRNYTVRNFFRDSMSVGDLAFFYHSVAAPTGIVGVMKVVSEAYPDPTQFDPKSEYYDPKAPADGSRWITRDVEFVEKFSRCITLSELRETPGLEDMFVLRKGQRLSVMPVTETEFGIVSDLARRPTS